MDNEIHVLQADKSLQNFVVGGVLIQVAAGERPPSNFEDSGRSDHNLAEANDVTDLGVGTSCTLDPATSCRSDAQCVGKGVCLLKQNSGIGFNLRAADNIVRGNRISGRMERGISFAGVPSATTIADWYPGTCTLDASRMCQSDADCNIPEYDLVQLGSCVGVESGTFNGNSMHLVAEDNTLSGVFETSGLFVNNSDGFVVRLNSVDGGASGIRIHAGGIHGLIERNVVTASGNALYLASQPAFTLSVRLNDFTAYLTAIRTSNAFITTVTDISTDTGNYWGLPCPGFDPGRVLYENGTVNPYVVDGRPHGEPMTLTPDETLPVGCN